MGLWDELKRRLKQTGEAAETAAREAAAKAALEQAKRKVAAAAGEALDDAEAMLKRAEAERAGRPELRPSADATNADALIAGAAALEDAHRQRRLRPGEADEAPSPAEDPRAAARRKAEAELAALKAKRSGGGSSA